MDTCLYECISVFHEEYCSVVVAANVHVCDALGESKAWLHATLSDVSLLSDVIGTWSYLRITSFFIIYESTKLFIFIIVYDSIARIYSLY